MIDLMQDQRLRLRLEAKGERLVVKQRVEFVWLGCQRVLLFVFWGFWFVFWGLGFLFFGYFFVDFFLLFGLFVFLNDGQDVVCPKENTYITYLF